MSENALSDVYRLKERDDVRQVAIERDLTEMSSAAARNIPPACGIFGAALALSAGLATAFGRIQAIDRR